MHLCFLIKIKSSADKDNNIATGIITVNNFFAHWIRKVDAKRYGDDIRNLLLANTVDISRYSDKILKHLLEKVLKTIENDLLYSKEKLYFLIMLIGEIITQGMVKIQIIRPMKILRTEYKNLKIN